MATTHCLDCGTPLSVENTYKGNASRCRPHFKILQQTRYRSKGVAFGLLEKARQRARIGGYPFTITEADIHIPTHCPILGIPLERAEVGAGPQPNSPSLDKLVPALGYVPGNVHVISFRANRLKSDASLDEVRAVLRYMEERGE